MVTKAHKKEIAIFTAGGLVVYRTSEDIPRKEQLIGQVTYTLFADYTDKFGGEYVVPVVNPKNVMNDINLNTKGLHAIVDVSIGSADQNYMKEVIQRITVNVTIDESTSSGWTLGVNGSYRGVGANAEHNTTRQNSDITGRGQTFFMRNNPTNGNSFQNQLEGRSQFTNRDGTILVKIKRSPLRAL